MANPSKSKGTRAETKVVRFLEEMGWRAKRQPLSGSKDKGDIIAQSPDGKQWVIEVKAGRQCASPNRTQLTEWMRQAETEAGNMWPGMSYTENMWILVVVRYNRSIDDADVYIRNGNRKIEHCWLDEIHSVRRN